MGERLQTHPISTYVAVFSLLWASIVVENGPCLVAGYDAYLLVLVDCRRHVANRYLRNCVVPRWTMGGVRRPALLFARELVVPLGMADGGV
ncbi:hypothetical protein PR202_ga18171 [Eleusine coracana subsp. coracana]|uniref:Secreted protein n=1 Tax=Eleusine coracana subsp. coracana TaxID=191504 RepID=A0AAV5CQS0_ELECO|nr:hypothetical protein PR202_ga18171 [Eleusine coracana subsp. coracana]